MCRSFEIFNISFLEIKMKLDKGVDKQRKVVSFNVYRSFEFFKISLFQVKMKLDMSK